VLGLVVDAGGVGAVFEHVDGMAVDEGIAGARRLRRGQQVAGRPLHPEPAAAVPVDHALGATLIERCEADRQAVGVGQVVEGV
jgi:hypothetical protein